MDQIKIGKFISTKRKEKNITQSNLAEMLGVTDRAVSKWETGICMPDAGTIPELCKILNISINDLFSGETVEKKEYYKKLEENLLKMIKEKQLRDKELLSIEIFIGVTVSIILMACVFTASFVPMLDKYRILLIIAGIIPFIIGVLYSIRIEQIAGFYECKYCHYKYLPTYKKVLFSAHINRTRKMKCPNCQKKSWNKKVVSK